MPDQTIPPPQSPGSGATGSRTEPLAIISLVLAILSWIMCLLLASIPAIVCGHLARSKIRRSNGTLQGMNFALVGLIIAYLNIPMGIFGGIVLADMIRSDRARLHDLAVQKKEILSDDGGLSITASGFWVKRTDLNEKSTLQAAYKDKEMYVIVLSDPKSSSDGMTLQQRHQSATDDKLHQMSNSAVSASVPVTVDGHPALQNELSGTGNGANLTFLHTTVDEPDSFIQIIAWTLKSRWPANQSELRDITQSFRAKK
jgi:Domain of unknown function (DUF4190)